jgi:hypothetical protein
VGERQDMIADDMDADQGVGCLPDAAAITSP